MPTPMKKLGCGGLLYAMFSRATDCRYTGSCAGVRSRTTAHSATPGPVKSSVDAGSVVAVPGAGRNHERVDFGRRAAEIQVQLTVHQGDEDSISRYWPAALSLIWTLAIFSAATAVSVKPNLPATE